MKGREHTCILCVDECHAGVSLESGLVGI